MPYPNVLATVTRTRPDRTRHSRVEPPEPDPARRHFADREGTDRGRTIPSRRLRSHGTGDAPTIRRFTAVLADLLAFSPRFSPASLPFAPERVLYFLALPRLAGFLGACAGPPRLHGFQPASADTPVSRETQRLPRAPAADGFGVLSAVTRCGAACRSHSRSIHKQECFRAAALPPHESHTHRAASRRDATTSPRAARGSTRVLQHCFCSSQDKHRTTRPSPARDQLRRKPAVTYKTIHLRVKTGSFLNCCQGRNRCEGHPCPR